MKLICPTCAQPFAPENINLHTDLALCTGCDHIARPSELADAGFDRAELGSPPKGAWFRPNVHEIVIGATTRHLSAFLLVPFTCVWAGGALGGIYGMQIRNGQFSLMLSLFGLPFLAGSIALITMTLMAIAGKVEVRLRGRAGVIFVGVGPVGWKRAFNLTEVESIAEEGAAVNYPGGTDGSIVLRGRTRLRFATHLTEARRHFIAQALKAAKAGRL